MSDQFTEQIVSRRDVVPAFVHYVAQAWNEGCYGDRVSQPRISNIRGTFNDIVFEHFPLIQVEYRIQQVLKSPLIRAAGNLLTSAGLGMAAANVLILLTGDGRGMSRREYLLVNAVGATAGVTATGLTGCTTGSGNFDAVDVTRTINSLPTSTPQPTETPVPPTPTPETIDGFNRIQTTFIRSFRSYMEPRSHLSATTNRQVILQNVNEPNCRFMYSLSDATYTTLEECQNGYAQAMIGATPFSNIVLEAPTFKDTVYNCAAFSLAFLGYNTEDTQIGEEMFINTLNLQGYTEATGDFWAQVNAILPDGTGTERDAFYQQLALDFVTQHVVNNPNIPQEVKPAFIFQPYMMLLPVLEHIRTNLPVGSVILINSGGGNEFHILMVTENGRLISKYGARGQVQLDETLGNAFNFYLQTPPMQGNVYVQERIIRVFTPGVSITPLE
ncbi:hypothetical protein JW766_03110 [Candidatus Dojkabacteria bacterium]|nr:hypothetical protein [Candidatus Dojkabacteria bacterium]